MHEDHFGDISDESTLKKPLSIEQRIRRASELSDVQPSILERCGFRLEVNDKIFNDLSQEQVLKILKSLEADPELNRYKNYSTFLHTKIL